MNKKWPAATQSRLKTLFETLPGRACGDVHGEVEGDRQKVLNLYRKKTTACRPKTSTMPPMKLAASNVVDLLGAAVGTIAGSAKAHERGGCLLCHSQRFCQPQDFDYQCPCDWHATQQIRQASSFEAGIRKQNFAYQKMEWPKHYTSEKNLYRKKTTACRPKTSTMPPMKLAASNVVDLLGAAVGTIAGVVIWVPSSERDTENG
ncbi:hypothetical protein CRUP_016733 [Coryphaenoides rupestris]|nr:hypothetical protein CRUP_016733 [Coryphaenoides rupestris]